MYEGNKVSLIIPAYNEEATIGEVVSEFKSNKYVDEVLVVDNNCKDRTAEIARSMGARVVEEKEPGYGKALKRGMMEAEGDILVLTEADGSFKARDLIKLLVYLHDAGMVVGTRTTRQLVHQAANMRSLLRWGNVFMAKYLELLWFIKWEPRFTDVGCTYRALWKKTFEGIKDHLHEAGPAFSPEMMCEVLMKGFRCIEVPVSYHPRKGGDSKHSANIFHQARTAWSMFKVITKKKIHGKEKRREA